MRKNSLMWVIALFLVIASLPIAHAQFTYLFAGGNLLLVLLNSAIVGVILFVLQAFLIPNKGDKERTATWVAIIAGALLVGFMFGSQTWIWQHPTVAKFLNPYVLVNAIIIATLLYFILGLMKFQDKIGASKEGLGGYAILLFLVALIFSLYIGNKFIWELDTARQFVNYLFGTPDGILNPSPPGYKLWIFITSFVMFAFFMSNFLASATNTTGSKVLNYALAFVIASNMASAGYGFASIIQMGEIIFTLVLWKGIKSSVWQDKDGGRAFLIAIFLVGWASAAVTATSPDYRGVLGYGVCHLGLIDCKDAQKAAAIHSGDLLDKIWKNWWAILLLLVLILVFIGDSLKQLLEAVGLKKDTSAGGLVGIGLLIIIVIMFMIYGYKFMGTIGLFLLIPLGIIALALFGITRAGKKEKSAIGEGKKRGWQEIKRKLRQNRAAAWVMRKVFRLRNESFPDELPFDIKDMRLEIYTLMNWMLRHEVWMRKGAAVTDMKKEVEEAERRLGTTRPTEEDILRGIKDHIEGAQIGPVNGIWDKLGDPRNSVGWGRFYFIFVQFMNQLKQDLEKDLTQRPEKAESATTQAGNWIKDGEGGKIISNAWKNHIDTRYNRYLSGIGRYKGYLITRANKQAFWDMLNMYGTYKRGYLFAKPGALAEHYSYNQAIKQPSQEDVGHTITRSIDLTKVVKILGLFQNEYKEDPNGEELLELNIYGFSISDINKIEVEGINLPYIRRFRVGYIDDDRTLPNGQINPDFGRYKSDVSELHVEAGADARFQRVLTFSEKDWEYATKDMLTGVFHPLSRRVDNYQRQFDITDEKFSTAPFDRPLGMGEVAFDREALKIPHTLNYWGRKRYFDQSPDGSEVREKPANPYPGISLKGLWDFIFKYSTAAAGDPERTKKILNDYFKSTYEVVDTTYQEKKGG